MYLFEIVGFTGEIYCRQFCCVINPIVPLMCYYCSESGSPLSWQLKEGLGHWLQRALVKISNLTHLSYHWTEQYMTYNM